MKKNLRIISILMVVVLSLSGCSLNQAANDNGQINNITPITVDEPSNDIDINEPEEPVLNEVPIEVSNKLPVEPDLSNNHVFENGICTDCGMVWTEVFTENLAAIENVECDEYGDYGFVHYYGQDSEYTYPNAYVQYISAYRYGANMCYIEYGTDSLSNETIINVSADPETKDSISEIRITFRYMDDYQSQYQGIVTAGFIYDFEVIANPGEFDKVFASKESLLANCHYSISIYDDEMQSYDYYDNPEDSDDLPNDFMDKFISKEEICDLVNKDYANNLNALNEGMTDINLSLFELGLNYK